MSNREQYCISKSSLPSSYAKEIEKETYQKLEIPQMVSGDFAGSVLGLLARASGAKRVLEFGTFSGYSALVFAQNIPDEGEVHTLDINPDSVAVGKPYWEKAGVSGKIHSHIGPALESVKNISGNFDLVFIDADKENYLNYFKYSLERLNPGGMILLDNCLWGDQVLDPNDKTPATVAIREVNDYIASHEGLYKTLLPVRDGIFVVTKK